MNKTTLRVTVLRKHITAGEPHDQNSCPIALALKDLGFCDVYVWADTCDIDTYDEVKLPLEARQFITRFDNDKICKPFTFELEVPHA